MWPYSTELFLAHFQKGHSHCGYFYSITKVSHFGFLQSFNKQQLTWYIWQNLPNSLPWLDTHFTVQDLLFDPGKIIPNQSRQELKEDVCNVLNVYSTCQRCCRVGNHNCNPSLGPVDEETQKFQFSLWQHHHGYEYIISKSVTEHVPVSVSDKEAPDLQTL